MYLHAKARAERLVLGEKVKKKTECLKKNGTNEQTSLFIGGKNSLAIRRGTKQKDRNNPRAFPASLGVMTMKDSPHMSLPVFPLGGKIKEFVRRRKKRKEFFSGHL